MIKEAKKIQSALARDLLSWYDREKRSLPWRKTTDPYRIWVSEIMLQQTRVDTVIPYYHRFLEAFPSVGALAEAPLQEVLKVWENLGYYARARHLHTAAGMVVEKFSGRVPDTRESLKTLPGVGQYAMGAILSIAYGQAVPAVDGNVRRILSRLFALEDPVDQPRTERLLQQVASLLIPRRRSGDFNQALMDLGATICRAKTPDCPFCPLVSHCRAQAQGRQHDIPRKTKGQPLPQRLEAAAVVWNRAGHILMVQRPAKGLLGSLWKFPGGFIKEANHREDQLQDLIAQELGVRIHVGPLLAKSQHAYTHFRTTLYAYESRISRGKPCPPGGQAWLWVPSDALRTLPLAKIDRMIADDVLGRPLPLQKNLKGV